MKKHDPEITIGSDNVFADLGIADAASHKLKAELVSRIHSVIKSRNLTQAEAGRLMAIGQPDLSRIVNGRFRDVSVERLIKMLTRLDMDVDITISHHGEPVGETIHYEMA